MNCEYQIIGKNISKSFEREIPIFKDLNLKVPTGAFFSLMGPSGCGKSTLLKILAGLEKPDRGKGNVKLNGQNIFQDGLESQNDSESAEFRRNNIGFIFQSHQLLPELNVIENVILPLQLKGKSKKSAKKRGEDMLNRVNLFKENMDYNSFPEELSVGQQQRVGIARALIHKPSIIFADEPTASLDEKNAKEVIEMLQGLQEEYDSTILMITHSPSLVDNLDGRIEFVRENPNSSYNLVTYLERTMDIMN